MPNTKKQIEKILDELRPSLMMHGGDVDLVSFEKGIVTLKVKGTCVGCPMVEMTFDEGVGEILKNKIPDIKEVRYE